MAKWKRSRVIYLAIDDKTVFSLNDLLQGRVEPSFQPQLCAFDLIRRHRVPISFPQLEFLLALSSDQWVESDSFESSATLEASDLLLLTDAGWLLTDGESEQESRARELEANLSAYHWHPDALFFHRMSQLKPDGKSGEFKALKIGDVATRSAELAQKFVNDVGLPPPASVTFEGKGDAINLPMPESKSELAHLLHRRRTVRAFDTQRVLASEPASTLLKYSFGALGGVELTPGVRLLKKGSPSGGALHPIEAFPLLISVEGMSPGLYHYDVLRHRLQPMAPPLTTAEAKDLAQRIGAGQLYVGDAHMIVLLVARFHRNHWKYRNQSRTYSVMMLDAGHLSQTFYLMATHLGLGAFFSAAIDTSTIEEALGLPPEAYGPLGICGCGYVSPRSEVPYQGSLPFVG